MSRESHWLVLISGSGRGGGDPLPGAGAGAGPAGLGGGDGAGPAGLGGGGVTVTSLQAGATGAPSSSGGWNPSNHGNPRPTDEPQHNHFTSLKYDLPSA